MALLTPQGVKRVYQCQKPEGREYLRRLLNWEEFDEVRDSRRSILLDTLYESIIFAVGKGFPWVEVVKVVKFTEELLKETKGPQTLPRRANLGPSLIRPTPSHVLNTSYLDFCSCIFSGHPHACKLSPACGGHLVHPSQALLTSRQDCRCIQILG
uniref:Chromosome 8 open reading frame 74 n=1 Tax=Suricata suricatta TaxID=37032 RepID=A0A673UAQ3_SURSU